MRVWYSGRTYDALGDGLTDGVDLGSVSTTTDADADVDTGWRKRCVSCCSWYAHCAVALIPCRLSSNARKFPHPPRFHPLPSPLTKLVSSEKQNWLVDLESQDLWLDERKRLAVDLDQALALLAVCDGSGSLLLAETLDALDGRHLGGVGGDAVDSGGGSCRVSCRAQICCCWRLNFRGRACQFEVRGGPWHGNRDMRGLPLAAEGGERITIERLANVRTHSRCFTSSIRTVQVTLLPVMLALQT